MSTRPLTPEEVAEAHAAGRAAAERFQRTLASLVAESTSVDGLEILARAGFSVIMSTFSEKKHSRKPGLELFHLELIQALALSRARAAGDPSVDYPGVTQRIIDLIGENAQAYQEQAKSKVTADRAVNRQQEMLNLIQRWKLAVRGARQGFQTREYASDLASSVNLSFRHHYGCDATAVVAALSAVADICQKRLEVHLENMRTWMTKKSGSAMLEAFIQDLEPRTQADITARAAKYRHDRKQLEAFLWNINEQRLVSLFTLSTAELMTGLPGEQTEAMRSVLKLLTLDFGAVMQADLDHLHLDNPVQLRPLIRVDHTSVFCAGPQILGVHLAEIVEGLCAKVPKLKKAAEKARADWLENQLSSVVRKGLPHADVREQVKWSEDGGKTTWESDLVAFIDKTVLIFEAKSAKISGAARRGAIRSLKEALDDLVVSPSEQSLRLKQRIIGAKGVLSFESRQGQFFIAPKDVLNVHRFNIVHDVIGPLSSHWPQLKAAGLVPDASDIAPTLSVFDLETVFDLVPREIDRCHYLRRRMELERNTTYTADELDLLALYLKNRFNLGEIEYDGADHSWYGLSMSLTYVRDEERQLRLFSQAAPTTTFWTNLLTALEEKRPDGWIQFGDRLLNVDVAGQQKVERLVRRGQREVSRRPHLFFQTGVTFGASKKLHTIAIAVGAPTSSVQFENNLRSCSQAAFEQGGQDDLLLLYWLVPRTAEAYDFMDIFQRQRHPLPGLGPLLLQ